LFSQAAGNINRASRLNIEPIMNSTLPKQPAAPPPPAPAPSRWVQFNRALATSVTAVCRPGMQGRWKPSDRVAIAA